MIAFVRENCFREVIEDLYMSGTVLETDSVLEQDTDTYTLYNMSSAINRGVMLSNLTPPPMVGANTLDYDDEKSFDIMYANYLLGNDAAFVQMFSIINNLYLGGSSIILVGDGKYKDVLTDSLIKFIQQRYGLSPIRIINEIEDWYSYEEDYKFNLIGVYNLDVDKERFTMLTTDFNKLGELVNGEE